MKAKCFKCFGENEECEKCNSSGFIDVKFAEGEIYESVCQNEKCGFINGGKIFKTPPKDEERPNQRCVICREESLIWVDEIPDDYQPAYYQIENRYLFDMKNKNETIESLKEIINELRQLALSDCQRNINVKEAKLLRVCQICKEPDNPSKEKGAFVFNENEYAHRNCMEGI